MADTVAASSAPPAPAAVLVIDGNETMREGVAATVRRMGHRAITAKGGRLTPPEGGDGPNYVNM